MYSWNYNQIRDAYLPKEKDENTSTTFVIEIPKEKATTITGGGGGGFFSFWSSSETPTETKGKDEKYYKDEILQKAYLKFD